MLIARDSPASGAARCHGLGGLGRRRQPVDGDDCPSRGVGRL